MSKQNNRFSQALLEWYKRCARELPWRERMGDPYAIWVSEVMLQQTQVDTVIPYFHRFLQSYPTLAELAAADEEELLKLWEGLGYYRRARLLLQGVREVVSTYAGEIPSEPDKLRRLPGVGDYMAGSIASIAFNRPEPAVDGNVVRVVTRFLAWDEEASTARSRRYIRDWVRAQIPPDNAGDFTQAMMELGALVCRPKGPCCTECPVGDGCRSRNNNPQRYPVKRSVKKTPVENRAVFVIWRDGRLYMEQRPSHGLLAGMWELPNALLSEPTPEAVVDWAANQWGQDKAWRYLRNYRQTFSHRIWELTFYETHWPSKTPLWGEEKGRWLLPEEMKQLPRVAYLRGFEKAFCFAGEEEENSGEKRI